MDHFEDQGYVWVERHDPLQDPDCRIFRRGSKVEDKFRVSPSGYITGVDYGPCFGGCTRSLPCNQTQGRHWFNNPANAEAAKWVDDWYKPGGGRS